MPQPITSHPPQDTDDARSAANTMRETIAHFFANDANEATATPVTNHTLRDIGVDRTIFGNL